MARAPCGTGLTMSKGCVTHVPCPGRDAAAPRCSAPSRVPAFLSVTGPLPAAASPGRAAVRRTGRARRASAWGIVRESRGRGL